tara:strand:+ start:260 stop:457 length:198 start_codon:yes stop_codon:yes gene_type:complete
MIKIGDKVYYWQTMHKIGVVVDVIRDKNNIMTEGGTTASQVFFKVEYPDGKIVAYRSGDLQKHYD